MISVIVPAYNVEKTIKRTLDSILKQTYSELEVVVIDDGSTDHTGKIIDWYQKKYPKKIRVFHVPNEGVTAARMRGVRAAKGTWIGFVDGDDEIDPDMYEKLLKNALKYHADISHCGYQMQFSDGRIHYFYNTGILVKQEKTEGVKELWSGERVEPGMCNKLFRKTLFENLCDSKFVPLDIKINEDLLMNYYLFGKAESSVFEDVCKYHYLVRNLSATRVGLNKHKIYDPVRVKQIILEDAAKEIKECASKAYMSTLINVYNSLMLDNTKQFLADEAIIRKKIIEHKDMIQQLRKKQKLQAYILTHIVQIYKPLYRFYAKYFMKNRYE